MKKISKGDLSLNKEGCIPLNSSAGQETSGKDAQTAVEFCNTATNCHSFLQTQCDCDETKGDSCIACETKEKCPNTTDCGKTQSNAVLCCDETVKCAVLSADTNCYVPETNNNCVNTNGCPATAMCLFTERDNCETGANDCRVTDGNSCDCEVTTMIGGNCN